MATKEHPRAVCGHRWYPVTTAVWSGLAGKKRVILACPLCFKWTEATFEWLGYELDVDQADVLRQRKKLKRKT